MKRKVFASKKSETVETGIVKYDAEDKSAKSFTQTPTSMFD